jgi:hypothetical protein
VCRAVWSLVVRLSSARRGVRDGEASQPRPARADGDLGIHGPHNGENKEQGNKEQRAARLHSCSLFSVLCSGPTNSGSPANKAKEPLPPRSVVQCVVASTPAATGSGLAGRKVVTTPAGSCCFRLDELRPILLRLHGSVKRYVTPLAIGLGHMSHAQCGLFDTGGDTRGKADSVEA